MTSDEPGRAGDEVGHAGKLYPGARTASPGATGEPARSRDGVGERLRPGLGLDGEARLERQAEAVDRRLAVGKHRLLREGGERLGVLERAVQRAAVQLGQQADRLRLARVDHPAGEDDVERAAEADD